MPADKVATRFHVGPRRFVFQPEPLREPQCAERLAGGEKNLGGRPDDELHASPADVEAERRAAVEVDHRTNRAKNIIGFLFAGYHADADADVVANAAQKLAPVRRFANGAGGHRDDLIDLPAPRDLDHLAKRGDGALDGIVIQRGAVETSQAELHHLLLFVDDAIGALAQLGHDHVHRVRPDVDGRHAARRGKFSRHCTPNLHRVPEKSTSCSYDHRHEKKLSDGCLDHSRPRRVRAGDSGGRLHATGRHSEIQRRGDDFRRLHLSGIAPDRRRRQKQRQAVVLQRQPRLHQHYRAAQSPVVLPHHARHCARDFNDVGHLRQSALPSEVRVRPVQSR